MTDPTPVILSRIIAVLVPLFSLVLTVAGIVSFISLTKSPTQQNKENNRDNKNNGKHVKNYIDEKNKNQIVGEAGKGR